MAELAKSYVNGRWVPITRNVRTSGFSRERFPGLPEYAYRPRDVRIREREVTREALTGAHKRPTPGNAAGQRRPYTDLPEAPRGAHPTTWQRRPGRLNPLGRAKAYGREVKNEILRGGSLSAYAEPRGSGRGGAIHFERPGLRTRQTADQIATHETGHTLPKRNTVQLARRMEANPRVHGREEGRADYLSGSSDYANLGGEFQEGYREVQERMAAAGTRRAGRKQTRVARAITAQIPDKDIGKRLVGVRKKAFVRPAGAAAPGMGSPDWLEFTQRATHNRHAGYDHVRAVDAASNPSPYREKVAMPVDHLAQARARRAKLRSSGKQGQGLAGLSPADADTPSGMIDLDHLNNSPVMQRVRQQAARRGLPSPTTAARPVVPRPARPLTGVVRPLVRKSLSARLAASRASSSVGTGLSGRVKPTHLKLGGGLAAVGLTSYGYGRMRKSDYERTPNGVRRRPRPAARPARFIVDTRGGRGRGRAQIVPTDPVRKAAAAYFDPWGDKGYARRIYDAEISVRAYERREGLRPGTFVYGRKGGMPSWAYKPAKYEPGRQEPDFDEYLGSRKSTAVGPKRNPATRRKAAPSAEGSTAPRQFKRDAFGRFSKLDRDEAWQQRLKVTGAGSIPVVGGINQARSAARYAPPGQEGKHARRQYAYGPMAGMAAGVAGAYGLAHAARTNDKARTFAETADREVLERGRKAKAVLLREAGIGGRHAQPLDLPGLAALKDTTTRLKANPRVARALAPVSGKNALAAGVGFAGAKFVVGATGTQLAISRNQRDQRRFERKSREAVGKSAPAETKAERHRASRTKRINAAVSAGTGLASLAGLGLLAGGRKDAALKLGVVNAGVGGANGLVFARVQARDAKREDPYADKKTPASKSFYPYHPNAVSGHVPISQIGPMSRKVLRDGIVRRRTDRLNPDSYRNKYPANAADNGTPFGRKRGRGVVMRRAAPGELGPDTLGASSFNGRGGGRILMSETALKEPNAVTIRHELAHVRPKRNPDRAFDRLRRSPFSAGAEEGRADALAGGRDYPAQGADDTARDHWQQGYDEVHRRVSEGVAHRMHRRGVTKSYVGRGYWMPASQLAPGGRSVALSHLRQRRQLRQIGVNPSLGSGGGEGIANHLRPTPGSAAGRKVGRGGYMALRDRIEMDHAPSVGSVKTSTGQVKPIQAFAQPTGRGGGRIMMRTDKLTDASVLRHELAHIGPRRNPYRFMERKASPLSAGGEEGRADALSGRRGYPNVSGHPKWQQGYDRAHRGASESIAHRMNRAGVYKADQPRDALGRWRRRGEEQQWRGDPRPDYFTDRQGWKDEQRRLEATDTARSRREKHGLRLFAERLRPRNWRPQPDRPRDLRGTEAKAQRLVLERDLQARATEKWSATPRGKKWLANNAPGRRGDLRWGPNVPKSQLDPQWQQRQGFGLERRKPSTGYRGTGRPYAEVGKSQLRNGRWVPVRDLTSMQRKALRFDIGERREVHRALHTGKVKVAAKDGIVTGYGGPQGWLGNGRGQRGPLLHASVARHGVNPPRTTKTSPGQPKHSRVRAKELWTDLRTAPVNQRAVPPRTFKNTNERGDIRDGRGPRFVHKADGPLEVRSSKEEQERLLRQYGDRGPLPKGLDRDTKMKAYEARYVAHGGPKVDRYARRAEVGEGVRNAGLVGATVGGAGWLAARTKRGGAALGRVQPRVRHAMDTAAVGSGVVGGAGELYAEHARGRRASYANTPGGVAASSLRRMRAYTPEESS